MHSRHAPPTLWWLCRLCSKLSILLEVDLGWVLVGNKFLKLSQSFAYLIASAVFSTDLLAVMRKNRQIKKQ